MTNEQYYDFIQPYQNANAIMRMKLEVLNHNLYLKSSEPIHHIQERVKEKKSIEEKLERMNYSDSVQNAKDHLLDVAGIRVICYFVDDIHNLVNALKRHVELIVIREKDYITNPKPNGYRSFHMIVGVPVYYLDTMEYFGPWRWIFGPAWSIESATKSSRSTEKNWRQLFSSMRRCWRT